MGHGWKSGSELSAAKRQQKGRAFSKTMLYFREALDDYTCLSSSRQCLLPGEMRTVTRTRLLSDSPPPDYDPKVTTEFPCAGQNYKCRANPWATPKPDDRGKLQLPVSNVNPGDAGVGGSLGAIPAAATDKAITTSFQNDVVNVLTRTSGRPMLYKDAHDTVAKQSHKEIRHLVVTDDENSLVYVNNIEPTPANVTLVPSRYQEFDPVEVCRKCRPDMSDANPAACAKAPGLNKPGPRKDYFECFCSTNYPMNAYFAVLHQQVQSGWVMYLDDDNVLATENVIDLALSHARSTDDLLLWRTKLGRITPNDANWEARNLEYGDIDTSMFMFHSKHLDKVQWKNQRCGDYHTIKSLEQHLNKVFIDQILTMKNPDSGTSPGLGMRSDKLPPVGLLSLASASANVDGDASSASSQSSQTAAGGEDDVDGSNGLSSLAAALQGRGPPPPPETTLTVVTMGYDPSSFRVSWLQAAVDEYTSVGYRDLVDQLIIVWNNMEVDCPIANRPGVKIVRGNVNSLNNRWTLAWPHIRTKAVLVVDDDLLVKRAGMECMLGEWNKQPYRLVGPFSRHYKRGAQRLSISRKYGAIHYDLRESATQPYSLLLPRLLMVHRDYFVQYSELPSHLRQYVDDQAAHCDDLLLNIMVAGITLQSPQQIVLPPASIVDFYQACEEERNALKKAGMDKPAQHAAAGLANQGSRTNLRTECLSDLLYKFWTDPRHLQTMYALDSRKHFVLVTSNTTSAGCLESSRAGEDVDMEKAWKAMFDQGASCTQGWKK